MAVKIKLMRMGKIRAPYYRIVVADARTKRDGRAIEQIGKYHPKQEPSLIEIDSERAQHWLRMGAQPTGPVQSLLKVTGDWQKFRGETGSEGSLKTAAARPDKKEAFAAALKEVHGESTTEASRPKSRGKKADADAKADKAEKAPDKAGKVAEKTAKTDKDAKADKDSKADKADKDSKADKADKDAKVGAGKSAAETTAEDEEPKGGKAESKAAKDEPKSGNAGSEADKETAGKSGGARSTAAKKRDAGGSSGKADADGKESATSGKSSSGA